MQASAALLADRPGIDLPLAQWMTDHAWPENLDSVDGRERITLEQRPDPPSKGSTMLC